MKMEIISVKEAKVLNPLLEEKYFVGALYDEDEGSVDPYGVTHAYAICARNRGAEVYTNTWVTGLNHRRRHMGCHHRQRPHDSRRACCKCRWTLGA
ncbi:MAG: FAD-binding oxidoreductase [Actinobacteria bacterium]|nr:FAD-binding oxidoreductase [Actinomycetota bacterium]